MKTSVALQQTQKFGPQIMQQLLHRIHGFAVGGRNPQNDRLARFGDWHLLSLQLGRGRRNRTSSNQAEHSLTVTHEHDRPRRINHILTGLQRDLSHSGRFGKVGRGPVQLLHGAVQLVFFTEETPIDHCLQAIAHPQRQPGRQQQNQKERNLLSRRRVERQAVSMSGHTTDREKRSKTAGDEQRHQYISPPLVLSILGQHQPMPQHPVGIRRHKQHARDEHRNLGSSKSKLDLAKKGEKQCVANRNRRQQRRAENGHYLPPLTRRFDAKQTDPELANCQCEIT